MQIKEKLPNMLYGLALVYFVLYFMKLLGFPDLLMLALGAFLCLGYLIVQKKIRLNAGLVFLTFTMFSYGMMIWGVKGAFIMLIYVPLVICVLADYFGASIGRSQDKGKKLFAAAGTLVVGFSVHGLLNSYLYFAGYNETGRRFWMDIWTKMMTAGTQHAVYFLPLLAVLFPAVIYFSKRKVWNSLVILLGVFFCYTSLATRSRMQLVILLLVCAIQFLLYIFMDKESFKKNLKDRRVQIMLAIALILAVVGFYFIKDSKIVTTFVENLGKGGGILHNVRFEAQAKVLSQLLDYPMGGRQMDIGRTYCHNVWLDMANAAGIIPFAGFTAYTVWSVCQAIKFVREKTISVDMKMMFVGLYAAFFLYFTVEPALEASIHFITPWVFLNGLMHGYLSENNRH